METNMDHHDNPALDARLEHLRATMAALDSPQRVETALMQAFGERFPRPQPWYRRLNLPEWTAAGAGSFVTAAVLGLLLLPPRLADQAVYQPPVGFDDGAAFIAFDSVERVEAEPDPRLVEAEVPRTMLAALGLPVTPENAGDAVHAELLVGAGGEPLALRLTPSLASID